MPSWDDGYDVPNSWSATEHDLYDGLTGGDPDIAGDQYLQALFDSAMFSGPDGDGIHGGGGPARDAVYDALVDYLDREYGIDFDDVFDWEGYENWYEG